MEMQKAINFGLAAILVIGIIFLSGCVEEEKACETAADCASRTCYSAECIDNICVYSLLSDCCGNDKCEPGETYENCVADCPNCDDKNDCTVDEYDYHLQECVNTLTLDVVCCGNGICEMGENYSNCARDCSNCDDGNECTKDSYDYHEQQCVNEIIIPCCGNGICDEDAEAFSNCPADCPDCDDNKECTEDSYDYDKQKCVNKIIPFCCGNTVCEAPEDFSSCPADCPDCDDGEVFTRDSFNYETLKCENTPLLELKEGFKYYYEVAHHPQGSKRDSAIYVTKVTNEYWEGIAGIKVDHNKKAYLIRWIIYKDDLDISITLPLTEDSLFGDVDYISDITQVGQIGEAGDAIMPFWMSIIKEMSGIDLDELITTHMTALQVGQQNVSINTSDPALYRNYMAYTLELEVRQMVYDKETEEPVLKVERAEIIMSAAEPYLVMKLEGGQGPQAWFKRVEQKEFSFDDYAGYSIEEWTSG